MQKIGKVFLDDRFYCGRDQYTDGKVEEELLNAYKNGTQEELLYHSNQWPILYHVSDIRENLLEWYPFTGEETVLEIGSGCGAMTGVLSRKTKSVTCVELSKQRSMINAYKNIECGNVHIIIGNFQEIEPHLEQFDCITLIGVWEYSGLYINGSQPYLKMLEIAKKHLKPDGKIIIAIENKMGLKYWNGAPEDHTGELYSGLNDYINNAERNVRTFSKQEIESLLKKAGIFKYNFYYPMPDYKLPDVIYSDEFLPLPGSERNFGKDYSALRWYNFNDAVITDQVCADGMFAYFANSFLVVTGNHTKTPGFIKYNRCRDAKFRLKTEVIYEEKSYVVRKTALNLEARTHIVELKEKEYKCKKNIAGIRCLEGFLRGDEYIVPYVEGTDMDYLFYSCRNDAEEFVERFKNFKEQYLKVEEDNLIPFQVSEEFIKIFGESYPQNKKSLKCTNIDMTFSNMRLTQDGQAYCFDYEWVFDFLIPYEYVIWRAATQLYDKYRAYLKMKVGRDEFLIKIGIAKEDGLIYQKMENHFAEYVYGKDKKELYLWNYRKTILMQDIRMM